MFSLSVGNHTLCLLLLIDNEPMNTKNHIRWLYKELPDLVSRGVLPAEAAARIRNHYGDADPAGGTSRRWAVVLFSILGAVLVGGGVILLLAHNWEDLSRPLRAAIAVAPLALTAATGAWLLWTGNTGTAWREGVGAAQTLAIGSSIALVSQTYHLGGSFDTFMLTWSLLALPIGYLLGATLPAMLYLAGIATWTGAAPNLVESRLWYFPLLAAVLPLIVQFSRAGRSHPRPILLWWALALSAGFGVGLSLERICDRLHAWPVVYAGLFAVLYLAGKRWWSDPATAWQRPLQSVGALGSVGLALIYSFSDTWRHANWFALFNAQTSWPELLQLAAAAALPLAALVLWAESWRRRAWSEVLLGAISPLALLGWIAAMNKAAMIGMLLFNLYLLALGIGTLVLGLRGRQLGTVNAGMAVLAAAILCRFFDSNLDFLVRGLGFILVGIGFLATNLVLIRKKGDLGHEV